MSEGLIAMGVDGAKGGWIAACAWADGASGGARVTRTELVLLESIDQVAAIRQQAVVAIDVPIGLPTGDAPRPCDQAARRLLGVARASSVFPAPARWMLKYAGDYTGLRAHVAQRMSAGERVKSISAQGHALIPKILEVDELLAADPAAGEWLLECHPEVCFRALAHGEAVAAQKKTTAGRQARRDLVADVFPDAPAELDRAARDLPRSLVAIDDLHDAYACLHAALAVVEGTAEHVGPAARDESGRPMQMVCAPVRERPAPARAPRTDVALRPATEADVPFLLAAERSEHAGGFVGHSTEAEHRDRIASPERFAVHVILAGDEGAGRGTPAGEGDPPAGFVILSGLDDRDGNVEVVRFVVTRPGEGIGPIALRLAIDDAFRRSDLPHRVWLDAIPSNARALRLYRALGFVEEGTLREAWVDPQGTRSSLVILSVLRHEWQGPGAA